MPPKTQRFRYVFHLCLERAVAALLMCHTRVHAHNKQHCTVRTAAATHYKQKVLKAVS
jgi:hypothetical protein